MLCGVSPVYLKYSHGKDLRPSHQCGSLGLAREPHRCLFSSGLHSGLARSCNSPIFLAADLQIQPASDSFFKLLYLPHSSGVLTPKQLSCSPEVQVHFILIPVRGSNRNLKRKKGIQGSFTDCEILHNFSCHKAPSLTLVLQLGKRQNYLEDLCAPLSKFLMQQIWGGTFGFAF